MEQFRRETKEICERYKISIDRVFNADQTGLYYQKLPTTMYIKRCEKKTVRCTKQMKDKTRITLMVCTSAVEKKCPLAVVGNPQQPECFRLLDDPKKPPLPYKS
eukprot:m.215851 g.215851  ORF g.215851 m.215851 type:complete len:104 (+) comp19110_c0_seq25:264-575(+)